MNSTNRANEDVRRVVKNAHIPLWRLALALNISEPTMTRKLRQELSPDDKQTILELVKSLNGGEQDAG